MGWCSDIHVVVVGAWPAGGVRAGGPANATARLVEGLAGVGVRITVVTPSQRSNGQRGADDGIDVLQVPGGQRFSLLRGMRGWRDAVVSVIESLDPDLIHGQGALTGGVPVAAARGMPRVVTARGNSRMDTLNVYPGLAGRVRAGIRDRLIRDVVNSVEMVIDVHPDWRVNLPVEPRRLAFVPNIVDDRFFDVGREPDEGAVLYCGGTRRIKGWDVLEAAWPLVTGLVPDARLRLVGWPTSIPAPALDAVEVQNELDSTRLAEEMRRAAVVVIPSRYEVAPILLAEAWAVGVPVVATEAGGMGSLGQGAAVVVPVESARSLAESIAEVISGTRDVAALVAAGRERAERHRASAVVATHMSLYAELLERSH